MVTPAGETTTSHNPELQLARDFVESILDVNNVNNVT